ncbi:hypothetical protein Tco_0671343 [Tanacetum coccineum]
MVEVSLFFLMDTRYFTCSKHRQCTRHIYANFKRKWSGLQYKRFFWGTASYTVEQQFLQNMEKIKELDPTTHKWLVERNLNSWFRVFFEINRCSTAFKNGISESFNSRIVPARGKPIITMLEDIRIYIMQRMCHMNKLSFKLEDTITPFVRRKLENLKEKQRQGIDIGTTKKGNTNVLAGSSKKRGTIRIRSLIKRGEDNQVTEGGSMGDGNLTVEKYQHKIDMEALAEVQREITAEEAEQERIRKI